MFVAGPIDTVDDEKHGHCYKKIVRAADPEKPAEPAATISTESAAHHTGDCAVGLGLNRSLVCRSRSPTAAPPPAAGRRIPAPIIASFARYRAAVCSERRLFFPAVANVIGKLRSKMVWRSMVSAAAKVVLAAAEASRTSKDTLSSANASAVPSRPPARSAAPSTAALAHSLVRSLCRRISGSGVHAQVRSHCYKVYSVDFQLDSKFRAWVVSSSSMPDLHSRCADAPPADIPSTDRLEPFASAKLDSPGLTAAAAAAGDAAAMLGGYQEGMFKASLLQTASAMMARYLERIQAQPTPDGPSKTGGKAVALFEELWSKCAAAKPHRYEHYK
jgi:hypothetical protein